MRSAVAATASSASSPGSIESVKGREEGVATYRRRYIVRFTFYLINGVNCARAQLVRLMEARAPEVEADIRKAGLSLNPDNGAEEA
jgi:hypothetical protein